MSSRVTLVREWALQLLLDKLKVKIVGNIFYISSLM